MPRIRDHQAGITAALGSVAADSTDTPRTHWHRAIRLNHWRWWDRVRNTHAGKQRRRHPLGARAYASRAKRVRSRLRLAGIGKRTPAHRSSRKVCGTTQGIRSDTGTMAGC